MPRMLVRGRTPVNGQVNWPGVMPSELAALCPSLHVVRLLERTG